MRSPAASTLLLAKVGTVGTTGKKLGNAQVRRHWRWVQASPAPQVTPQAPQFDTSLFTSTHIDEQVLMHAEPQTPAEQVARWANEASEHGAQLAPQLSDESARHWPPQLLKPGLHVNEHDPVMQARAESAGPLGQGEQLEPHESTLVFDTHALPQRWKP
ncbi:MAG: hypothetical protein GQE15_12645, partial [Archangiaceae bacterium]|nr:hypothetical protein [Archangiaceae bacterium]